MTNFDFNGQTYDAADVGAEMLGAAQEAAMEYYNAELGGEDKYACGFAWVTLYPAHKGNTKLGRAERKVFRAMGFELDYTGKSFHFWNPSRMHCQNVDTKEVGARAAAQVLVKYGFEAQAGSRLD